jgi:sec-independent protein translocase protein TatA
MFGVSPTEMLVLMLVALLVYGGELPKVARSWGKSLAEFKKGLSSIQSEFNNVMYDEPRRIPYHDPVYSHNAGTIDGHLADDESHAPEAVATRDPEISSSGSTASS